MDGESTLRTVPVASIRENETALRKVDRASDEYQNMLQSVRKNGVIQTITVCEKIDPVTKAPFYLLIDGLHRLSCAKDAGLPTLDVKIVNNNDEEILYTQIVANMHRIETKPVEYATQLKRILAKNPTMTITELAEKVSRNTSYVSERLGLLNLEKSIGELVDAGKIDLTKAFVLAKLDTEHQKDYVSQAMTLPANEFVPLVKQRIAEINKANRAGRDPNAVQEFVPVAHVRKIADLKTELDSLSAASELLSGVTDVKDAYKRGIEFALNLDPLSVAAAKAKYEARKAAEKQEKEAKAAKAKADKEAKAKAEQASIL